MKPTEHLGLNSSEINIQPGFWLAHTASGELLACCEDPAELDEALRKAGKDSADVRLVQVPVDGDDEMLLGGAEVLFKEESIKSRPRED
jgi:hypothetical protein